MDTAFRSEERFTQEEFWDWLDTLPASSVGKYELIGGRIVVTPPAGWPHGTIEAALCHLIRDHVRARGLGRVFGPSTGYDFTLSAKRRDTLQLDCSFVSRERWQAGPVPPVAGARGFLPIVPNLVVEVLSRSTAKRDRGEKCRVYARAGVDEYWIVDPLRREVTVHHRAGRWFDDGVVVASGAIPSRVLPELGLVLEALFADLD